MTGPGFPAPPPPGWAPPPLGAGAPPPLPAPTQAWAPPTGGPAPVPGYPGQGFPVPSGPGAPARRPRGPLALAVVLGVVLLLAGAAALWAVLGGSDPNPTPTTGVPTAPVEVTGGDLGRAVTLTGPDGTATLTASAATWTPEGELAPEEGSSYLVVDVALSGTSGSVAVGGVFTVAISGDGARHTIAYGPVLDRLLASTRLREGVTAQGQLGYQLPPGPVRIEFQDPGGSVLGSISVPGP